jgi:hypothetical protein
MISPPTSPLLDSVKNICSPLSVSNKSTASSMSTVFGETYEEEAPPWVDDSPPDTLCNCMICWIVKKSHRRKKDQTDFKIPKQS